MTTDSEDYDTNEIVLRRDIFPHQEAGRHS
jgi:hypothetical protein